jgi:hypothetical protein
MLKSVFLIREPRTSSLVIIPNVSLNFPKGEPFVIYTRIRSVPEYEWPPGTDGDRVPLVFSRGASSLQQIQIRRIVARVMAIVLLAQPGFTLWLTAVYICTCPIVVHALIPVYYL